MLILLLALQIAKKQICLNFIKPNLFLVFNVKLFIIPGSQRLHVYIRDFKIQRRGRQQERQINNRFYKQKKQLCTCTTPFCTFLCPFLHDHDVKMPNFAFYGERKQATTKCSFSFCTWIWSLGIQLQEGSPTFDKVTG